MSDSQDIRGKNYISSGESQFFVLARCTENLEAQRFELIKFLQRFLKGDSGSFTFSWDQLVSTITSHPDTSVSFTTMDRTTINRAGGDIESSLPVDIANYVDDIFGESIDERELLHLVKLAFPPLNPTDQKGAARFSRERSETYGVVFVNQGQNEKQFEVLLITIKLTIDVSTKSQWWSQNVTTTSNAAAHIVGVRLKVDASFKASEYHQDDHVTDAGDSSFSRDTQNSKDTEDEQGGKEPRESKEHEDSQGIPAPFTPETQHKDRPETGMKTPVHPNMAETGGSFKLESPPLYTPAA